MGRIFVSGGTGPTARNIVSNLLQEGAAVRVLVGDAQSAEALKLAGAEVFEGQLRDATLLDRALSGVSKVLLTAPASPNLLAVQSGVIAAAVRAGVSYIVKLSLLGARADSPSNLCRLHGQVEAALETSGTPFVHLRPNFFMQNILEAAPMIRAEGVIRAPLGSRAIAYLDRRDLERAAVRAIQDETHGGRGYNLTGPESLHLDRVAEMLSELFGRRISYKPVSLDFSRQAMLDAGTDPWFTEATIGYYEESENIEADKITNDLAQLTQRKATSFGEFAAEHVEEFTG